MLSATMPQLMAPLPELMGPMPQLMGMFDLTPDLQVPWTVPAAAIGTAVLSAATAYTAYAVPDAFRVTAGASVLIGLGQIAMSLGHLWRAKNSALVPPALINAARTEALAGGLALGATAIISLLKG